MLKVESEKNYGRQIERSVRVNFDYFQESQLVLNCGYEKELIEKHR